MHPLFKYFFNAFQQSATSSLDPRPAGNHVHMTWLWCWSAPQWHLDFGWHDLCQLELNEMAQLLICPTLGRVWVAARCFALPWAVFSVFIIVLVAASCLPHWTVISQHEGRSPEISQTKLKNTLWMMPQSELGTSPNQSSKHAISGCIDQSLKISRWSSQSDLGM